VRCRTLEDLAILRNRIAALDGIDSVETHPVLKDWI
jgi:hypothetical protein